MSLLQALAREHSFAPRDAGTIDSGLTPLPKTDGRPQTPDDLKAAFRENVPGGGKFLENLRSRKKKNKKHTGRTSSAEWSGQASGQREWYGQTVPEARPGASPATLCYQSRYVPLESFLASPAKEELKPRLVPDQRSVPSCCDTASC